MPNNRILEYTRANLTLAAKFMPESTLILASSSPFRKQLLKRLHLPFDAISPDIDESIQPGESASRYVQRLSLEKAQAVAEAHPRSFVIGSDQCAYLNGEILGKPGTHENALKQLQNARNQEVIFYTGLALLQLSSGFSAVDCIEYRVGFRNLSDAQLGHYLNTEKPYNCAGSFKSEAFGISLFSYMRGDDPTALIGLPLIRLTSMLESAGIAVL